MMNACAWVSLSVCEVTFLQIPSRKTFSLLRRHAQLHPFSAISTEWKEKEEEKWQTNETCLHLTFSLIMNDSPRPAPPSLALHLRWWAIRKRVFFNFEHLHYYRIAAGVHWSVDWFCCRIDLRLEIDGCRRLRPTRPLVQRRRDDAVLQVSLHPHFTIKDNWRMVVVAPGPISNQPCHYVVDYPNTNQMGLPADCACRCTFLPARRKKKGKVKCPNLAGRRLNYLSNNRMRK